VSAASTNGRPDLSVIVPTRDRPELLRRALASVIDQRHPGAIEILVVHDQQEPRDPGVTVPASTSGPRTIRLTTNHRSPGLAGARNSGVVEAAGTHVAFLDDDDEWLPGKVGAQLSLLARRPDAILASCGLEIEYESRVVRRVPRTESFHTADLVRSRVMELHPSTFLARTEDVTERIGLVDEGIPGSYGEDYEWLLRAARLGPIVAVRQPLARVHWHRSSWFEGRWETIDRALRYLLERYPELATDPRGLARLHGQLAFANAAAGHTGTARRWAWSAIRKAPTERRAYLALAVASGVVGAESILALAHRFGRGI
jgi:glycosyltransferase involved in cell wall biosynthesis